MRVHRGFATVDDPDPRRGQPGVTRFETFTCAHQGSPGCKGMVDIPFRCSPADAGGWCMRCDATICGPCADKGTCEPTEKNLERLERAIEKRLEVEGWPR